MQMLLSSVANIFSDATKEVPSAIAIYVTVFSIIGKLLLALYQYKQGKRIDSSLLTANAINMRNDVIISSGVLVGLVFTFIFKLPILDSISVQECHKRYLWNFLCFFPPILQSHGLV